MTFRHPKILITFSVVILIGIGLWQFWPQVQTKYQQTQPLFEPLPAPLEKPANANLRVDVQLHFTNERHIEKDKTPSDLKVVINYLIKNAYLEPCNFGYITFDYAGEPPPPPTYQKEWCNNPKPHNPSREYLISALNTPVTTNAEGKTTLWFSVPSLPADINGAIPPLYLDLDPYQKPVGMYKFESKVIKDDYWQTRPYLNNIKDIRSRELFY